MNTLYAPSVHLRDLATTLYPLFILWRDERLPRETFGDFCHRLGVEQLQLRARAEAANVS
jgi:sulfite reductase (ferredoxin)